MELWIKLLLLILTAISMPIWAAFVLVVLAYLSLTIGMLLTRFVFWIISICERMVDKICWMDSWLNR